MGPGHSVALPHEHGLASRQRPGLSHGSGHSSAGHSRSHFLLGSPSHSYCFLLLFFILAESSSGNKDFSPLTGSGFTFCWAGRAPVPAGSQEDPVAGTERRGFLHPAALHVRGEKRELAAPQGSASLLEPSCPR